jgi:hypothetical protein
LLDKQGRLLCIPVEAHEEGGMYTASEKKQKAITAELGHNSANMVAIRFQDNGKVLWGINREGKVIRVEFPNATPAAPGPVLRRASATKDENMGVGALPGLNEVMRVRQFAGSGSVGRSSTGSAPLLPVLEGLEGNGEFYEEPRNLDPNRDKEGKI